MIGLVSFPDLRAAFAACFPECCSSLSATYFVMAARRNVPVDLLVNMFFCLVRVAPAALMLLPKYALIFRLGELLLRAVNIR